jgi:thymidylate synthase (FAD)
MTERSRAFNDRVEITLRTDFDVQLIDHMGSDQMICRAARVSTLGADSLSTAESFGLINFLMRNRHGSPFEHGAGTARVTGPIFMWREFMRHRIGWSYNEESGRYKILDGVFYVPPLDRPLIQQGKPGEYKFVKGSLQDTTATTQALAESYLKAWEQYQLLLERGIAKEVARMCLPVATYSTAYVTFNPRSLMSFLSLRTQVEGSTFPSTPQWEINQVANKLEDILQQYWPRTHEAFNLAGRVAP